MMQHTATPLANASPSVSAATGGSRLRRMLCGAACALALGGGGQALAQQVPDYARPAYDAAQQAMLADPANLDKMFAFASIATEAGDYESAIGALERMLIFNKNLPRVRLELGALYYRLGSYETAAIYFESAIATPGVPDEVKGRAEEFLAAINKEGSAFALTSSIVAGARYQTNANAGSTGNQGRIFGLPATLGGSAAKKGDFSIFTNLNTTATYDPGLQNGMLLEARGNLYAGRQMTLTELSVTALEIDLGPRWFYEPADKAAGSIRPYITGSHVLVGDTPYSTAYGLGIETNIRLLPNLSSTTSVEYRRSNFSPSVDRAALDDRDGNTLTVDFGLAWAVSPVDMLRGDLRTSINNVNAGYETYGEIGLTLGYYRQIPAPWSFSSLPWVASLQAGLTKRNYETVDFVIDPTVIREDSEFVVGAGLEVPLTEALGLSFDVRHTRTDSTLPNYKYNDTAVTIATGFRF